MTAGAGATMAGSRIHRESNQMVCPTKRSARFQAPPAKIFVVFPGKIWYFTTGGKRQKRVRYGLRLRAAGRSLLDMWSKHTGKKPEFIVENDTVGLDAEEKDVLLRCYFKFRSDYTRRQLDTDPENPELQKKHRQMVEDLEDVFPRPDFYFVVMTITAIAIR